MTQRFDRRLILGIGVVLTLLVLTLLAAPIGDSKTSGSTYSRAPDGYGAWYAYMERQGVPVRRWQRPAPALLRQQDNPPTSLLRVYSKLEGGGLSSLEKEWVERGNTLVLVGIKVPVTEAPFTSIQDSPDGAVKVETTRRQRIRVGVGRSNPANDLLGDNFGSVVWEDTLGKGRVIYVSTLHLGANAYQNEPGNYPFLARLLRQGNNRLVVDEYLHGYKDGEVIQQESGRSWKQYLAATPLVVALLQAGVILAILVWAENRRLGAPQTIAPVTVDNSRAYIQALSGVLQKAGSTEFVLEMVGKEEQLQIQRQLGLGQTLLEPETVMDAWERSGRSGTELRQFFRVLARQKRISEQDLATWLEKLQTIHKQL